VRSTTESGPFWKSKLAIWSALETEVVPSVNPSAITNRPSAGITPDSAIVSVTVPPVPLSPCTSRPVRSVPGSP
jgi:hypothetical protein